MLKDALLEIFERDLLRLKEEINLYPDEAALWTLRGEIANSAGTLCLHLVGNLNHFIGAALGRNGYVRTRDAEFAQRNVPRNELNAAIDRTVEVVRQTLERMQDRDFDRDFPLEKHGKVVKTDYMLLHLLTHFNYHLGQINYHRRLG